MTDNDFTVDQLRSMLDAKLNYHGIISDSQMLSIEREVSMKLCDTVTASMKRIIELEQEIKRIKGEQ